MRSLSGQSTGRYHILEPLGQGGMAIVYKAFDTNLDINVAIKFIRTERLTPEVAEKSIKRFRNEAQKTAKLMHPNIIPVTDYGEYNNVPFLVMRYIEGGKTLKSFLGKQIPWKEAVKIVLPIAEALSYAHKNKIVHRDVKPSNILITLDGLPMLSDFGIAKVITEDVTIDSITLAGMAIGTPEYMAPEQWEGKKVDGRADIYSLGVVLYEMITGRPPFKADTVPATMVQVLRDPLPRPNQYVNDLPDEVERILFKALAREPENRFSDCDLLFQSLQELINNPNKQTGFTPRSTKLDFFDNKESKNKKNNKRKIVILTISGIIVLIFISTFLCTKFKCSFSVLNKNNQSDLNYSEECKAIKYSATLKQGNFYQYAYLLFNKTTFSIPEGSYLEYDEFIPTSSPISNGGIDLTGGTLVTLRDFASGNIKDQNGIYAHPGSHITTTGLWVHRKISLDQMSGSFFVQASVAVDVSDIFIGKNNKYLAYYKDILITDGDGKIYLELFNNNENIPYLDQSVSYDLDPTSGNKEIIDAKIEVVPCSDIY